MTRHSKNFRPSDVDLHRNPLIGGSKGVTMAQASADDLAEIEGENTFVGDIGNDTNPQGGIDREDQRRGRPAHRDHTPKPRKVERRGRKTHEQQRADRRARSRPDRKPGDGGPRSDGAMKPPCARRKALTSDVASIVIRRCSRRAGFRNGRFDMAFSTTGRHQGVAHHV